MAAAMAVGQGDADSKALAVRPMTCSRIKAQAASARASLVVNDCTCYSN